MKRWLLFLLSLALLLSACQSTDNGAALEAPAGPVIARVGTETITLPEYEQRLETEVGGAIQGLLAQGQTPEQIAEIADTQNVREAIFESMIQEELLLLAARQEGIGADPEQVDALVEQAAPPPGTTDLDPTAEAEQRQQQRIEIAREQLITTVIARNTRAAMFNSRHILVEDEATAEDVVDQLNDGASFAELAEELSQDPGSAAEGGELGWVARGNFVPEFEEAAFSADLNTPVIVESQFGWHVIEVLDRAEDRAFDDFEQLRSSQNAQQFYENSFVPWYEQFRDDAEASGDLEISSEFDPNQVPLPFLSEQEAE